MKVEIKKVEGRYKITFIPEDADDKSALLSLGAKERLKYATYGTGFKGGITSAVLELPFCEDEDASSEKLPRS